MEVGPFRGQRSADGKVTNGSTAYRQPAEAQPAKEEPKVASRPVYSHNSFKDEKKPRRFVWLIIIAAVVVLGIVGWLVWSSTRSSGLAIDTSKYQAVFFTNGQVYFGKLQALNGEYMKLTDIYYLQTPANQDGDSKNPQDSSSNQSDVQLIKLGQEIHGPEDAMIISKDQMLFYENLKTDGKVAQSIANHKKQQ